MSSGRPTRPLVCTYRLQLHAGFGFDDAVAIVPYLARLGVSHVYCSPYLQAAAGSTHGYDVVDHDVVNRELGGAPAHARFLGALDQHGLGQVVDVVPNHMAVGTPDNRWWWDVLENGPASAFADHFDVDWDPPESKLRDQVLVPVLGDHYGRALERGEIAVVRHGARFVVEYFEHRFPVAPRSLDVILGDAALRSGDDELAFLADAAGELPEATTSDPERLARRQRDVSVVASMLERRLAATPVVAHALDDAVAALVADHDALHRFLERQNYRLAYWRTGTQELDYRRFFDVTMLAGLRVERPEVFAAVHRSVLGWYADGTVDGLRIDHPDGLRDPTGYLQTLRAAAPDAWLLVEKILEPDEQLPAQWPVAGTTGYEFARYVDALFVDPLGEPRLTALVESFTGCAEGYDAMVLRSKRDVLREVLAADVARLTEQFRRVCESQLRYRDFTRPELRRGLEAALLSFDVYRTYVRHVDGHPQVEPGDRRRISEAIDRARVLDDGLDVELFEFLFRILALEVDHPAATELAMRFQQLTGPTMAKGVEDTAFYRSLRLVSLNEVGGDPGRFGLRLDEFHRHNEDAAATQPQRMLASTTHDTKRSEDVRARISLLAECTTDWADAVERWSKINHRHRRDAPVDRATEYLLYQTLVGTHPIAPDRVRQYVQKAIREAKEHTSWLEPDDSYEASALAFVDGVMGDEWFLADLDRFVAQLVVPARVSSLARTVLKLTCPGVPDVYQGAERWTDSLVDPDNRRPVDHARSARLLDQVASDGPMAIVDDHEGVTKQFVHRRVLALRHSRPDTFAGSYEPIEAEGPASPHAVAFVRGAAVAVCVPRFTLRMQRHGGWSTTTVRLPSGRWRNVLTDTDESGVVRLDRALERFPVAVWESIES